MFSCYRIINLLSTCYPRVIHVRSRVIRYRNRTSDLPTRIYNAFGPDLAPPNWISLSKPSAARQLGSFRRFVISHFLLSVIGGFRTTIFSRAGILSTNEKRCESVKACSQLRFATVINQTPLVAWVGQLRMSEKNYRHCFVFFWVIDWSYQDYSGAYAPRFFSDQKGEIEGKWRLTLNRVSERSNQGSTARLIHAGFSGGATRASVAGRRGLQWRLIHAGLATDPRGWKEEFKAVEAVEILRHCVPWRLRRAASVAIKRVK